MQFSNASVFSLLLALASPFLQYAARGGNVKMVMMEQDMLLEYVAVLVMTVFVLTHYCGLFAVVFLYTQVDYL